MSIQSRILIHEKCNKDVELVLERLSQLPEETKSNFLSRLVEVYQNIYETPAGGFAVGIDLSDPLRYVQNYVYVIPGFPYLAVIYTRLKNGTVVILGIMSLETYYGLKTQDYMLRYENIRSGKKE
jgi:hypothetical protein